MAVCTRAARPAAHLRLLILRNAVAELFARHVINSNVDVLAAAAEQLVAHPAAGAAQRSLQAMVRPRRQQRREEALLHLVQFNLSLRAMWHTM